MPTNDPDAIDKIGQAVMSEPMAWTDLARQYVENDTAIPFYAFGAIGIPMVQAQYAPARQIQLDNLVAATQRIRELAQGLAKVAANWRGADHASTPVGRTGLATYTTPPGSAAGHLRGGVEAATAALLYGAVKLMIRFKIAKKLAGYIGKLEKAAYGGAVFWALTYPWDDPIERAIGAWRGAATQLAGAKEQLSAAIEGIDDAWEEGADRDAFDTWIARLSPEFDDAAQAATKNAEVLQSAKQAVIGYQTAYISFCLVMMTTIIALSAAERLPYVGPIAKVMKAIAGVTFVVGSAGIVGGIATSLFLTIGAVPNLMQTSNFGSLAVNLGGGGVGFVDVRTDWDDRLDSITVD